jgi:hypothetical protein
MTMQDSQRSHDSHSRTNGLSDAFIAAAPLHQQHFARSSPDSTDGPEKRLMFAVLVNAIIQLRSRDAHDVIEAENWIRTSEISDSPFSFDNICEVLGIESNYLARGLLAWYRPTSAVPRSPLRQIRASRTRIAPNPQRPRPPMGGRASDQQGTADPDGTRLPARSSES